MVVCREEGGMEKGGEHAGSNTERDRNTIYLAVDDLRWIKAGAA